MYPILRSLKVAALAWGRRMPAMAESVVRFRVWPNDIDVNLHLNNGRYLTLMDLGRLDLGMRSGLARVCLKRRWQPLVGAVQIRFRRGLAPLSRFTLHTRLVCWDEKWFYLEQRTVTGQIVRSQALIKILVRDGKKNLPPQMVADAVGAGPSPPMPEEVRLLRDAEEASRLGR